MVRPCPIDSVTSGLGTVGFQRLMRTGERQCNCQRNNRRKSTPPPQAHRENFDTLRQKMNSISVGRRGKASANAGELASFNGEYDIREMV
jgi:hypothetical protein